MHKIFKEFIDRYSNTDANMYFMANLAEEKRYVVYYMNKKETINNLTKIVTSDNQWRINAKKVSLEIAKNKYDSKKVVYNAIQYFHGIIGKN